jgi:hypothetical protein
MLNEMNKQEHCKIKSFVINRLSFYSPKLKTGLGMAKCDIALSLQGFICLGLLLYQNVGQM